MENLPLAHGREFTFANTATMEAIETWSSLHGENDQFKTLNNICITYFVAVIKYPEPNTYYSTYEQPVQSFLWADFTAKPSTKYVYKVIPVTGKPKLLKYGEELKVEIKTESLTDPEHEIHFNRGVAASQAYS